MEPGIKEEGIGFYKKDLALKGLLVNKNQLHAYSYLYMGF